jgi:glutamyl-tRNA synthetase
VFSVDEMIQEFTFERISLGGPVFDLQKLDWLNGMYMRQLSASALAHHLYEQVIAPKVQRLTDMAYAQAITPLLQERLHTLGDFHHMAAFFYDTPLGYDANILVPKGKNPRDTAKTLAEVGEQLQRYRGPWHATELEALLREQVQESKWDASSLFMAMRVAITGRTASPPLFDIMQVLGKNVCLARLEDAVATLQK